MIDDWASGSESDELVALYQDEIGRLENEVRLRDEALTESVRTVVTVDPAVEDARAQRIANLMAEIATRDETIDLLLDQVRLFEEAERAARAEWEQLTQWLEEVEKRVEDRDTEGGSLQLELEAERRQVEAQRVAAETGRREWDGQRSRWENEVAELRKALADVANRGGSDDDAAAALHALEQENRRLRDTCCSLVRSSAEAAETGRLRTQLCTSQGQLEEARRELRQSLDDRDRERNEFEAALAALRSRRARESVLDAEPTAARAQPKRDGETPGVGVDAFVDERIRALRQHLREIHDSEQQERARNRLSARLSRLWRHTSPASR